MKQKPSNKIFDVSQPGKTIADSTSRPIIVSRKGAIKQDPMVSGAPEITDVQDNSSKDSFSAIAQSPRTSIAKKIVLQPSKDLNNKLDLSKTTTSPEPNQLAETSFSSTESVTDQKSTAPIIDTENSNPEFQNNSEENLSQEKTSKSTIKDADQQLNTDNLSQTIGTNEPAQSVSLDMQKADEMSAVVSNTDDLANLNSMGNSKTKEADLARNKELAQLVASKKYFLPIKSSKHLGVGRGTRIFVLLVLLILTVVAAYYTKIK